MSKYRLINSSEEFATALEEISRESVLAIDTESSSFHTYYPQICLIQLTAGKTNYIFDTLAKLPFEKFSPIFTDRSKVKIFHGATYDIAEMRRVHPFEFENVFDTWIASRLLGHSSCSLAALAEYYCGAKLSKDEQKSNWSIRPLSPSQLTYAYLDTVYLESIYDALNSELEQRQMTREAFSEFARIPKESVPYDKSFDPNDYLKIPGVKQMTGIERRRLKKIFVIREERARLLNLAPFRIARKEDLVRLVTEGISVLNGSSIHADFAKTDRPRIIEALMDSSAEEKPILFKKKQNNAKLKILKEWRKDISISRGIDPVLVCTNRVLEVLADKEPHTLDEVRKLDLISDWKLSNYGPALLSILNS